MPLPLPKDFTHLDYSRLHDLQTVITYNDGTKQTLPTPIAQSVRDIITYGQSEVSPRVGGRLIRRENAFGRSRRRQIAAVYRKTDYYAYAPDFDRDGDRKEVSTHITIQPTEGLWFSGEHLEAVDDLQIRVDRMARMRFDQHVANANANAGVLIGERNRTIRTISGRVLSLGHALVDAKDIFRKLARNPQWVNKITRFRGKRVTQASGYWLEFWFGWFPVISDLFTLQTHETSLDLGTVKGRFADSVDTDVMAGPIPLQIRTELTTVIKADMKITSPAMRTLAEFGLANPLFIAWELISLSWLIDYFFKIGAWLFSLQASVGVELSNTSTTRSLERIPTGDYFPGSYTAPVESTPLYSITSHYSLFSSGEYQFFYKTRVQGVKASISPLTLNTDVNLKQWANVFALIMAKLRKF